MTGEARGRPLLDTRAEKFTFFDTVRRAAADTRSLVIHISVESVLTFLGFSYLNTRPYGLMCLSRMRRGSNKYLINCYDIRAGGSTLD